MVLLKMEIKRTISKVAEVASFIWNLLFEQDHQLVYRIRRSSERCDYFRESEQLKDEAQKIAAE